MINLGEKREKIIDIMKQKGPILPIQVSREIELNSLFASAILSEMVSDKTLKVSGLKVGGSPLYFIPGQENALENFSNYLGSREKEVFLLLKERQILEDEKITPVQRISIRNIKDFAVPMKVNLDAGEKVFWRFYSITKEDAVKRIKDMLDGKGSALKVKQKTEQARHTEKPAEIHKTQELKTKETTLKDSKLLDRIAAYSKDNGITLLENPETNRKEAVVRASISSGIGNLSILIIAKDKKNLNEDDLNLALSKGQAARMPVLLLSTGSLNKKAMKEIESFKSYLIFRQLN